MKTCQNDQNRSTEICVNSEEKSLCCKCLTLMKRAVWFHRIKSGHPDELELFLFIISRSLSKHSFSSLISKEAFQHLIVTLINDNNDFPCVCMHAWIYCRLSPGRLTGRSKLGGRSINRWWWRLRLRPSGTPFGPQLDQLVWATKHYYTEQMCLQKTPSSSRTETQTHHNDASCEWVRRPRPRRLLQVEGDRTFRANVAD